MNKLVFISDDRAVLTSRDLAIAFEKRHDHVIRDIEIEINRLKTASEQHAPKFGAVESEAPFRKTTYTDAKGEKRKMYELTQKGFIAIAMGFTGDKAAALRWHILNEFEAVERELQTLRADRFKSLCSEEYRASLPAYHKSMHAVKALIEYACLNGATRKDIDPHYYKAVNAAINKALGIKNNRRPFLSPTATVHIRNINRLVKRTIEQGIKNNAFFGLILSRALDTITNYAADNIDPDERKRFSDFADAHKEDAEHQALLARQEREMKSLPAPEPDPDYDLDDDDDHNDDD